MHPKEAQPLGREEVEAEREKDEEVYIPPQDSEGFPVGEGDNVERSESG